MSDPSTAKLTTGPVPQELFRLAGPMVFGILSIMLMNAIDTYFVGQIGPTELAAMGFTFPVVSVIGSLSLGLGVGASSVISRAIGAGDSERVRRLTTDSLLLSVLIVGATAAAGLATIEPLFRMLGATDETLPFIDEYMSIWYWGTVFVVVPMVANAAIRATGDTRTPAIVMVVAAVANAVLDPILIFGWGPVPALGLAGAAIATVIARAVTLLVALHVVVRRDRMVSLRLPSGAAAASSWKALLGIGLPAAGANLLFPLTTGLLTRLVAGYGDDAVAGFGVGGRLDMLAVIPMMALGASLGPFVGQNWGAGLRGRVAQALRVTNRFSIAWGLAVAVLLALTAAPIAAAFNDDPEVVDSARLYLLIVPLAHAMFGVVRMAASTFNAMGRALSATALTGVHMPLLVIPLAWLGSELFGLSGIYWGMVVSNVLAGLLTFVWTRKLRRGE